MLGQVFVESFGNLLSSPHKDDLQTGVQGTSFVFYEKEKSGNRFCQAAGKENSKNAVKMVNSYVSLRKAIIRFTRTGINVSWACRPPSALTTALGYLQIQVGIAALLTVLLCYVNFLEKK